MLVQQKRVLEATGQGDVRLASLVKHPERGGRRRGQAHAHAHEAVGGDGRGMVVVKVDKLAKQVARVVDTIASNDAAGPWMALAGREAVIVPEEAGVSVVLGLVWRAAPEGHV